MKEEEGLTELEKSMRSRLDSHEFEFKEDYWKQYEAQYGHGKSNRKTILLFTLLLIAVTSSAWWLAINYFNTTKVHPKSKVSTLKVENNKGINNSIVESKSVNLITKKVNSISNDQGNLSKNSTTINNDPDINLVVAEINSSHPINRTNALDASNTHSIIDNSTPISINEETTETIQSIFSNELVNLYSQKTGSIKINIPEINSKPEPVKPLLAYHRQKQKQFMYIHSGMTFYNQKSLIAKASWEAGMSYVKFVNSRIMTSLGISYCGIQQNLPTRAFTSTTYSFGSTQFKTMIDVNRLNYICIPINIGIAIIDKHSIQFGAAYWKLLNGLITSKQINETDPPTSSTKHELGIPNGISNSDISVHIGYRYISSSNFIFDISYQKGLKDITSNSVYSSQDNNLNNGIILSVGYKLWR